ELISDPIPIIVIANKQDLPNALSPEFLKTNIFDKILKKNPYHIFGTVAADPGGVRSGENVKQAFKYLIKKLRRNQEVTIKESQV
ncbi:MAG: ADP-ribosylation factor-like protein, partial [Candidatus Thorarchaeota archaeon]